MTDDKNPEPDEDKSRLSGEQILQEVRRLKREPVRIGCLGMSAGTLLALAICILLLLWWATR